MDKCYHGSYRAFMAVLGEGIWMKGRSALTNKIESEIQLLERHVKMLNTIVAHEPIGIIRLSELLNIPQHKVRYSLRILEHEGLILPSPEGAITTERVQSFYHELTDILTKMDQTVTILQRSLETQASKGVKDK